MMKFQIYTYSMSHNYLTLLLNRDPDFLLRYNFLLTQSYINIPL